MTISFHHTKHEIYCLAVKIEVGEKKVVYTADTSFDQSLIPFASEADLLIAESSFYADFPDAEKYGHMNTKDVSVIAKESVSKIVLLTHFPHFGEIQKLKEEVEQEFNGHVILATTGLQVNV
jgi:ribonuclease BN (tRNA processing enzyme)